MLLNGLGDLADDLPWDGDGWTAETETAGDHAQHRAIGVDQGTTREPGVQDRVHLNEPLQNAAPTRAGRTGEPRDQAKAGVGRGAGSSDDQREGTGAWIGLGCPGRRE